MEVTRDKALKITDEVFENALTHAMKTFDEVSPLKPKQKEAIRAFVEGNDVFVVLPTGYGKSRIFFFLPLVYDFATNVKNTIIIISPLKYLIEEQLNLVTQKNLGAINLTQYNPNMSISHISYVFTTPETLLSSKNTILLNKVFRNQLIGFIVDEAHCVLNWGDSFRIEFGHLKKAFLKCKDVHKMSLTATASSTAIEEIGKKLQLTKFKKIVLREGRNNIKIITQPSSKINPFLNTLLKELIKKKNETEKTIIFCSTLDIVTNVYQFFMYYSNPTYHCFVDQFMSCTDEPTKKKIVNDFKNLNSTIRILIATNSFGMGVNSPGVTRIIHIFPPRSLDDYVQQIGRAGREGQPSSATIFFHLKKIDEAEEIKVRNWMTKELREFLASSECKQELIAKYYNLDYASQSRCCSNCEGEEIYEDEEDDDEWMDFDPENNEGDLNEEEEDDDEAEEEENDEEMEKNVDDYDEFDDEFGDDF